MVATNKVLRETSREYAYQRLKTKILNLELEPGTKISEKEIAEEFNVSRTPIREAFMKLAQEELLDIIPQSGTVVSRIHLHFLEEGRFIREKIEKEIITLACENFPDDYLFKLETNLALQKLCKGKNNYYKLYELDEEFHQLLYYGVKMERTWNMLQMLNIHFKRLRVLRLSKDPNWEEIISQHEEIYRYLVDKDSDAARQVIERHLQMAVIDTDRLKEKYPHYFISK